MTQDEKSDIIYKLQILMTKMDEKTSKDYVDNKLTDCVQKKSHYYLVDQLKECSTKED